MQHSWKYLDDDCRVKECIRCLLRLKLIGDTEYSSECEWKKVTRDPTLPYLVLLISYPENGDCDEEILREVLES
jgi:hypothetical protein